MSAEPLRANNAAARSLRSTVTKSQQNATRLRYLRFPAKVHYPRRRHHPVGDRRECDKNPPRYATGTPPTESSTEGDSAVTVLPRLVPPAEEGAYMPEPGASHRGLVTLGSDLTRASMPRRPASV